MKVSTPIVTIAILAAGMLLAGGMWIALRVDGRPNRVASTGALPNGAWGPMAPAAQGFTGPPPWGGVTPGAPSAASGPGGIWSGMGAGTPGGGPPGVGDSPGSAPKSMGGSGGSAQMPTGPGAPGFGPPASTPWPAWGQAAPNPPKTPSGSSASGKRATDTPSMPAPSPWPSWGQGPPAPPQTAAGAPNFGMWPGGPFGGPWGASGPPGAPAAPTDPASRALNDLQRQWGDLASAAQDVENASSALGERSQAQVKEMLQRGADRLRKVSEAWRRAAEVFGETSPAGGHDTAGSVPTRVFDLIAVPAQEPTAPKERAALEDTIRTRLRLLQAPYVQLLEANPDLQELQELQETIRSCRDAVNRGALREAAISFNAAAELMRDRLPAEEVRPTLP